MPFSSLNFAICVGLDTTDMIDFLYFVFMFVCFKMLLLFFVVINVIIIIMFCKLIEVFHNQY